MTKSHFTIRGISDWALAQWHSLWQTREPFALASGSFSVNPKCGSLRLAPNGIYFVGWGSGLLGSESDCLVCNFMNFVDFGRFGWARRGYDRPGRLGSVSFEAIERASA